MKSEQYSPSFHEYDAQNGCNSVYFAHKLGRRSKFYAYSSKVRQAARQVVFEYIEVFYNRIRCHAKIGNQAPVDFANQQQFAA